MVEKLDRHIPEYRLKNEIGNAGFGGSLKLGKMNRKILVQPKIGLQGYRRRDVPYSTAAKLKVEVDIQGRADVRKSGTERKEKH